MMIMRNLTKTMFAEFILSMAFTKEKVNVMLAPAIKLQKRPNKGL